MDLDTTSTKWSHQRILASVETGEVDLLLGTQMIAKGLDFPERDAGRRGGRRHRSLPAGLPLRRADVPAAGPGGGARGAGAQGRARAGADAASRRTTRWSGRRGTTPRGSSERSAPFGSRRRIRRTTSLVNLLVSGARRGGGGRARRGAGRLVRGAGGEVRTCRSTLLGPAPCPLARIKDRWRWHVLLKGPSEALGRIVRYAATRLHARGRRAGRDRSGSGVVALTPDLTARQPDTRSPRRSRSPAAAQARTPGRPLRSASPTRRTRRSHRLFTPRNGASWSSRPRRPSRAAGW